MEEEKLEKVLSVTKKGFPAMWVATTRYATPSVRFGQSCAICMPSGKMTKIIRTLQNYTKVKHLVRVMPGCIYIQSKYSIDGNEVTIYEISDLDINNKKASLTKLASFKDGKWDNPSYLNKYKECVHSTLMRAKKFYSLRDMD